MSSSSQKPSSQPSRSPSHVPLEASSLSYPNTVPETGGEEFPDSFESSFSTSTTEQYQGSNFTPLDEQTSYLHTSYSPRSPLSPVSIVGKVLQRSRFAPQSNPLYSEHDINNGEMMSHRDMGYAYMPTPIPAYSAGSPYGSTLAPMPGYYPDPARNLSGSSGSHYLPNLGFRLTPAEERERMQQRRRRNSTERRRQAKLQLRKDRLPSITGIGLENNELSSSPVDLFSTAPSVQQQTYVPDSISRSYSRSSMSPFRDNYRPSGQHSYDMSQHSSQPSHQAQQAYQSQAPYQPAYTMTALNPSTLAPSVLPTTSATYQPGRASPLLQTPLPPASMSISPHREPVVVDRPPRDKPQCWDHGCNGREFSTFSNLLRHQREKSGTASKAYCPRCGAEFTRTTARNGHMEHGKCKSRRPSAAETTVSNHSNGSMPR